MLELSEDKDLERFLEKINILEYIEKNSPCSAKDVKRSLKISKSELYRKLTKWANHNLIIKDNENKERKYYTHFTIIKQPLKTELLNLYSELIEYFSKKFKEIASIQEIFETNNEKIKIKATY